MPQIHLLLRPHGNKAMTASFKRWTFRIKSIYLFSYFLARSLLLRSTWLVLLSWFATGERKFSRYPRIVSWILFFCLPVCFVLWSKNPCYDTQWYFMCVCIQAWFLIGSAETVLKRVSSCQLQRTSLHTHKIQILVFSLYKQDTISDFWQLKIRLWFKRSWTIERVLFCDAVYCTLQDGSNFGVCG